VDLPFLNTSPSPEGADGGDDATLNDLLALYQSANDVPPPFAPLAESEPFPAAPAAQTPDFAAQTPDFAAQTPDFMAGPDFAADFASDLPFAAPAPVSPDAEIDDLIKSFQDAAPAIEPPPFATPEPFAAPAAPEPPFMTAPAEDFPAPPFAAPEPFAVPEADLEALPADFAAPAADFTMDPFAAPAIPDPFAGSTIPDPFAAPDLPLPSASPTDFMAAAAELEALADEVALQPAFMPEPEPVFAPEPAFAPEAAVLEAPAAVAVSAPETSEWLETPVEVPVEMPVVPAPVAEEVRSVVPPAAPVVPAAAVAVAPFTGELPSIATPAERQAINRSVLESLSAIATGIDEVQGELNGLYENLAKAASHRASVGEIVTLTERLTAVKGEVGENSTLYQQALQLRAVAEAYMQLLKNL
jgi:hypothetical protein